VGCASSETAIVLEADPGTLPGDVMDEVVFHVRRLDVPDAVREAVAPLAGPGAKAFPLELVLVAGRGSSARFDVDVVARKGGVVVATGIPARSWTEIGFESGQVVRYRFILRADNAGPSGVRGPPAPGPVGMPGVDAALAPDASPPPPVRPDVDAEAPPDSNPPPPVADAAPPPNPPPPDATAPPPNPPPPVTPPGPGEACGGGVEACRAGLLCVAGRCCVSACTDECLTGTCGEAGRCEPRPNGTPCHGDSRMACQDGACKKRDDGKDKPDDGKDKPGKH
jgi:hypothetical protein